MRPDIPAWTVYFNPLRPWGRRRGRRLCVHYGEIISTHSARGGGDKGRGRQGRGRDYFNPLRPWGRRLIKLLMSTGMPRFQPTPPVGAETQISREALALILISTHSARGGGD